MNVHEEPNLADNLTQKQKQKKKDNKIIASQSKQPFHKLIPTENYPSQENGFLQNKVHFPWYFLALK